MVISSHESGDSKGYFKTKSRNGQHIAEFKKLSEIAMGAPTSGELWVNGKRIFGHMIGDLNEDYGFSPSCAWSPDSHYLALLMWAWSPKRSRYTSYCIYDINAEVLHILQPVKRSSAGYSISNFDGFLAQIKKDLKVDLYKALGI